MDSCPQKVFICSSLPLLGAITKQQKQTNQCWHTNRSVRWTALVSVCFIVPEMWVFGHLSSSPVGDLEHFTCNRDGRRVNEFPSLFPGLFFNDSNLIGKGRNQNEIFCTANSDWEKLRCQVYKRQHIAKQIITLLRQFNLTKDKQILMRAAFHLKEQQTSMHGCRRGMQHLLQNLQSARGMQQYADLCYLSKVWTHLLI